MIQGKSCASKSLIPVARSMTSQGPVTASHGKGWSVQMMWTREGKLNSREASVDFPQAPALHGSRINENTSRKIFLMRTWHVTGRKIFIKVCFKTLCSSSEKSKRFLFSVAKNISFVFQTVSFPMSCRYFLEKDISDQSLTRHSSY